MGKRLVNRRKDGSEYTDDIILSPVYDDQNQLVNYISVQRDITRELELEKQYHHAQKMESIGRLTGSIAQTKEEKLWAVKLISTKKLSSLETADNSHLLKRSHSLHLRKRLPPLEPCRIDIESDS